MFTIELDWFREPDQTDIILLEGTVVLHMTDFFLYSNVLYSVGTDIVFTIFLFAQVILTKSNFSSKNQQMNVQYSNG